MIDDFQVSCSFFYIINVVFDCFYINFVDDSLESYPDSNLFEFYGDYAVIIGYFFKSCCVDQGDAC